MTAAAAMQRRAGRGDEAVDLLHSALDLSASHTPALLSLARVAEKRASVLASAARRRTSAGRAAADAAAAESAQLLSEAEALYERVTALADGSTAASCAAASAPAPAAVKLTSLLAGEEEADVAAAVAAGDSIAMDGEMAGKWVQQQASKAWRRWALLRARHGDVEQARSLLRSALSRDGENGPLWEAAARVEIGEGRLHAARLLLQRGLLACPSTASLWYTWARMEHRHQHGGGPVVARQLLKKGIDLCGDDVKLFVEAALVEEGDGNVPAAADWYARAAKRLPHAAELQFAQAEFELRRGNLRATERLLTKIDSAPSQQRRHRARSRRLREQLSRQRRGLGWS
eukprot:PLAT8032.2.p2 GENE.PLAT8032.2~~PLAT8032.2.p2  ORF type:complete len:399 (+),score=169.88 PLAT8032.2:163-1197(+)